MPDSIPRQLVLKRLEAETQAEDEWSALAALEGPGDLAKLVDEGSGQDADAASSRAPSAASGGEGSAIATAIEASLPQMVTSLDQLRRAAAAPLQTREDVAARASHAWSPLTRAAHGELQGCLGAVGDAEGMTPARFLSDQPTGLPCLPSVCTA